MRIASFALDMMSGCGEDEQTSTVPDSDDWKDMQVIMHGVRVKDVDNMTLDDLLDLGFKKEIISSTLVNANRLEAGDVSPIMLVAQDGSIGVYDVYVQNNSKVKKSVEKCDIIRIYIVNNPDQSSGAIKSASDIYLANGVGLGMTMEEVEAIMGEPTKEKDLQGKDSNIHKVWKYKADDEKRQEISIMFGADEKIAMIQLQY